MSLLTQHIRLSVSFVFSLCNKRLPFTFRVRVSASLLVIWARTGSNALSANGKPSELSDATSKIFPVVRRFCFAPPLHPRKSRSYETPMSAIAWRSGANRRRDKKVSLIDCIYSRRTGFSSESQPTAEGNEVTRSRGSRRGTKQMLGERWRKRGEKKRGQDRSDPYVFLHW